MSEAGGLGVALGKLHILVRALRLQSCSGCFFLFSSPLIIFSVSDMKQWCLPASGTEMGSFTFHVAE